MRSAIKDEMITTEDVRPMQSAAQGNGQEDQKGNKAMKEAMTDACENTGKGCFCITRRISQLTGGVVGKHAACGWALHVDERRESW